MAARWVGEVGSIMPLDLMGEEDWCCICWGEEETPGGERECVDCTDCGGDITEWWGGDRFCEWVGERWVKVMLAGMDCWRG